MNGRVIRKHPYTYTMNKNQNEHSALSLRAGLFFIKAE